MSAGRNASWDRYYIVGKISGPLGGRLSAMCRRENCTSRPKMTHGVRQKSPTIYDLYAIR